MTTARRELRFQFSLRTLLEAVAWVAIISALWARGSFAAVVFCSVPLSCARLLIQAVIERDRVAALILVGAPGIGALMAGLTLLPFIAFYDPQDRLAQVGALLMLGAWSGALVGLGMRASIGARGEDSRS